MMIKACWLSLMGFLIFAGIKARVASELIVILL